MVLVLDTSGPVAALAVLTPSGHVVSERLVPAGRGFDLAPAVAGMIDPVLVTRVGVAVGPGSFTGIRSGASYALGLCLGLQIPLHRLLTLEIAAARALMPVVAASEAGRGRLHFQAPGGPVVSGGPGDLPLSPAVTGRFRESTITAIREAGRAVVPEAELIPFGEAAMQLLRRSPEVAYGRLSLEYMGSFGGLG